MELPSVAQSEIVHAFLEGTTCRDLVRELGRSPPVDSNELFDIATSFSSGEEAVGRSSTERKASVWTTHPRRAASPRSPSRRTSGARRERSRAARRASRGTTTTTTKLLLLTQLDGALDRSPRGPGVFDDMLKKPCPYHKTSVNHTLEQCDMLKRFYGRAASKDGEAKKDGGDGDAGGFPAVDNIFLIFGGPTVDMSNS
jgi:hypothetical protein